jgi:chorismate mutase
MEAATGLLEAIVRENGIQVEDIASVFFTVTPDLDAEFPARAARNMGWTSIGLLCAREIDVPASMNRVLRVLIHANLPRHQKEMKHQYLGETAKLRPESSGVCNDDSSDEIWSDRQTGGSGPAKSATLGF